MSKVLILLSTLILSLNLLSCGGLQDINKLENENLVLRYQLDSLNNNYKNLFEMYIDVKDKPQDTIYILVPTDSINWIDSIRYTFKDSLVLIPHDTTIINFKDSIVMVQHDTSIIQYKDSLVLIPHDTLITNIKDSLVYNYRDTLLYNYKDSILISYDERTFPEKDIEKYLNLFYKTDNVEDTSGLKYNFSVFDGQRRSYSLDTNYSVPDSLIGWQLEWYYSGPKNNPTNDNELKVITSWWKETGLAAPVPITQLNDNNLTSSYNFSKGYIIADLGDIYTIDSIHLYLSNQEEIGWWLSPDNVEQGKEKYVHDGNSHGNGFFNCYIPKNKIIRFINISTESGIDWELKELKVYGK